MADVIVTLSGDEAKLFRAQQKIIQQQLEMESGYTSVERAAKKAAAEAQREADKTKAVADRLNKSYADQTSILEEQITAIKQGTAASVEQKAIREGLTAEQAKTLAALQDTLEATKKLANEEKQRKDEAKRLDSEYQQQTKSLELQLLELEKGKAASIEQKAIQQGLTAEQAKTLATLQNQIDAKKKLTAEEQKSVDEASKLEKEYKQQTQQLELQLVALRKGTGAANEQRAIQQGLTRDQAARIKALHDEIDAEKTKGATIKDSVTAWVTGLVSAQAAYTTISKLATAYVDVLREARDIQKESLEIANNLGKKQSVSLQNLTGLTPEEKKATIKEAGKIAVEVGIDRAAVEQAIGAGYSAVGDIAATKDAVKAAAKITALTPENLSSVTTGALDARRATGVQNAEANLSFLLQAGKQARVEDPAKTTQTLAKALSSGVNTVPTQDKQTASREVAAVFTELTQFANDLKGESTATAVVTLTNKLEEFFREIPKTIDELDAKIKPLAEKNKVTDVEKAQLEKADFDVKQKQEKAKRFGDTGPKAAEAKIDLESAIARRDKLRSELSLDEADAKKLSDLQAQRAALDKIKDPGTVFGRIEELQKNTEARSKFLENPFGEAAYQGGFRQLLEGGDLAKRVKANKAELGFDPRVYQTTVAEMATASPELAISREREKAKAREQEQLTSSGKPTIGLIREITENSLKANRDTGIRGATDYLVNGIVSTFAGGASNVESATKVSVAQLQNQINRLNENPDYANNREKIANLTAAQDQVLRIGTNATLSPTTAAVLPPADKQDRAIAEKTLQTLERMEQKLGSQNQPLDRPTSSVPVPSPQAIRAQAAAGASARP